MYQASTCLNQLTAHLQQYQPTASLSTMGTAQLQSNFSLAALLGDASLVHQLQSSLTKLLASDVTGYSALYHAFANGHYAIAKTILLEALAKGESCYQEFCLALQQPNYMYFLADHGADGADSHQCSPLDYAKQAQHVELIKHLSMLQRDKLRDGFTPLHHAVFINNPAYIQFLLTEPCAINQPAGPLQVTPLGLAAYLGHTDMVVHLCQQPTINLSLGDAKGHLPAAYAISQNHIPLALYLLQQSAMAKPLAMHALKLLALVKLRFATSSLSYQTLHFFFHSIAGEVNTLVPLLALTALWLYLSVQQTICTDKQQCHLLESKQMAVTHKLLEWVSTKTSLTEYQQWLRHIDNAIQQQAISPHLQVLHILKQAVEPIFKPSLNPGAELNSTEPPPTYQP